MTISKESLKGDVKKALIPLSVLAFAVLGLFLLGVASRVL
jgi:hypothetical protein